MKFYLSSPLFRLHWSFPLLLLFLIPLAGSAQPSEMKFGEPTAKELAMTTYKPAPEASAVILGEYGRLSFDTDLDGFEIVFEHIQRIKILSTDGLDQANIRIPLYKGGKSREKLTSFLAISNNADSENSRISIKQMFLEDSPGDWQIAKFTIPRVEVGSVIDIQYEIQTDNYYDLRKWYFQHDIPCAASEYVVELPEFFNYQVMISGYEQMADYSQKDINRVYPWRDEYGDLTEIRIVVRKYRYIMRDVPAFYPEIYMANRVDYISSIHFKLASVKFPHSPERKILSTWEGLNKWFLEHKDIGVRMRRDRFLKDVAEALTRDYPDAQKRISAAFELVSQRMEWNGEVRKFCEQDLSLVWAQRSGNSAEINLILASLLQRTGIVAEPVMISTRAHGKIPREIPFSNNFNDLVVRAEAGDKAWIIDATDPSSPFDLLPERCLNGDGLLLRKDNPGWVRLYNGEQYCTRTTGLVNIQPDGSLKGIVRISYSGLNGVHKRATIKKQGEEKYLALLAKKFPDWEIEDLKLSGVTGKTEKVEELISFGPSEPNNLPGAFTYVDPLANFVYNKNPFQREKRLYPVDIGCSIIQEVILTFTIPEGYAVEEVPENISLALPDKGGSFRYVVSAEGSMIQMASTLKLTGPVYSPDFYPALRDFYGRIIEKQAEQFVLKKI